MFALVQFLVDKIHGYKAIVPVKDIKNFNVNSFENDSYHPYEVFWKSPNGEGTYWYAVVLLIAETKELIEQQWKRTKLPTPKRLDELLAYTLNNEAKHPTTEKEIKEKNKEILDKRSTFENYLHKEVLKRKLKEKRKRSLSDSQDENKSRTSTSKRKKRVLLLSESESSDGDDVILKSELNMMREEHEKVSHKLKLKQEENMQLKEKNERLQELNTDLKAQLLSFGANELKKKNERLQELNMNLQAQLLSFLGASALKTKNERLQELNMNLQAQLLSFLGASGNFKQNESPTQESILEQNESPTQENILEQNKPPTQKNILEQNKPPTQKLATADTILNTKEKSKTNNRGNSLQMPSKEKHIFSTDDLHDQAERIESNSQPTLEQSIAPFEPSTTGLHLNDNNIKVEWKNEQLELAPGIIITKDEWCKIASGKNLNPSRFTRNLAVFLWGSETLKKRSVMGLACRRFKNNSVQAKKALSPVKVDACQNGLKYWLTEQGKKEQEALELSSTKSVRRMLSDKIMDLLKKEKKNVSQSF